MRIIYQPYQLYRQQLASAAELVDLLGVEVAAPDSHHLEDTGRMQLPALAVDWAPALLAVLQHRYLPSPAQPRLHLY